MPPDMLYSLEMTNAFKTAIEEVESLPPADQELIGRELLSHVEKLRTLRADIDGGLRSLDAGQGEPLDIEEVIRRSRDRYGE